MTDDAVLQRLRQNAEALLYRLSRLRFESPQEWPNILDEFSVIAKVFSSIYEDLNRNLSSYILCPKSLDGLENPMILPDMLRTRLEPEMDAEDAAAKAEWEEAHGTVTREKAEELSEQRLAPFEDMCADLQALIATKKEELEKELKQRMLSSSGPTPREDMKSILASMQAMIRRGEGIKQEAPQRKPAVAPTAAPAAARPQAVYSAGYQQQSAGGYPKGPAQAPMGTAPTGW